MSSACSRARPGAKETENSSNAVALDSRNLASNVDPPQPLKAADRDARHSTGHNNNAAGVVTAILAVPVADVA